MWQPMVNKKIKSNQELREYADFIEAYHAVSYPAMIQSTLKEKIDSLLYKKEQGWLFQIKELLSSSENAFIKERDEEVRLIDWLCQCYEKERKAGRFSLLFFCESLEQLKNIYQITVFYLNRIGLEMEPEYYADFFDFLREWNLSPEYIAMIIQKGKWGNNVLFAKRLVKVLWEKTEVGYGDTILQTLESWEKD